MLLSDVSKEKKYFDTLKLKDGWFVRFDNNWACKVHGVGMIWHKMFDDCDFFLQKVRYIIELRHNLSSISMFDDLGYYNIVEYGVLKISHGGVIMDKCFNICRYIF